MCKTDLDCVFELAWRVVHLLREIESRQHTHDLRTAVRGNTERNNNTAKSQSPFPQLTHAPSRTLLQATRVCLLSVPCMQMPCHYAVAGCSCALRVANIFTDRLNQTAAGAAVRVAFVRWLTHQSLTAGGRYVGREWVAGRSSVENFRDTSQCS